MSEGEHAICCRVCKATVSTGRCIGGCDHFDNDKYDRYHAAKTAERLQLRQIELLEEIAAQARKHNV